MTTPTNLKIDGLDFESIKSNFREFLKSQDKFKDYNFEASGLNLLLDVLSFNTYYNSFYVNAVSNEAFLSTAQRRNSVVSAARSLNYTPRSVTSSRINVNLAVSAVADVTIPAFTNFAGATETSTVTFVNLQPIFVRSTENFTANNVTLVEGSYVFEQYTVDVSDSEQRFIINNSIADTSTLRVRVQNSSTDSTIRLFTKADSYVNLNSESLVYFIEEVEDGLFELTFGNDAFGKSLQDGNVILIDYLASSGSDGNDVSSLNYAGSIGGVSAITVTVNSQSSGGDDRESVDRIKFNAPKQYASQNRLITYEDYVALLLQQPNVQSAIVWGGEDNDPPEYGKVFMSIQPKVGEVLTQTEKDTITTYKINPKKILTVNTEIVDPEYIYLLIDATVNFDSTKNVLGTTNLNAVILNKIVQYRDEELSQFSKYFRYSKLSRLIDTCDRSIQSSIMSVRMRKDVPVQLNAQASYIIDFVNPIDNITSSRAAAHPYSAGNKISSNEFTYDGFSSCFMEENGGIMRIYRRTGNNLIGVVANAGTVDYDTGRITLNKFSPSAFADGGTKLKLTAIPRNRDILPLRTQIVTIREADVSINLIDDAAISVIRR